MNSQGGCPEEIVTADIGGTHARFAIARISGRRVHSLESVQTFRVADHAGLQSVWRLYAGQLGRALPRAASLAVACPVRAGELQLTNSSWSIRPADLNADLGIERSCVVNDFAAVAHAVARLGPDSFGQVCGPSGELPSDGVVSVIGPGTGLGVAQLVRRRGVVEVVATEGGHIHFAPLNPVEERIAAQLSARFSRVSYERIVSGPGLASIYAVLAPQDGGAVQAPSDLELWNLALSGKDAIAAAALDRFCLCLGAFAGDVALVQGADAVVIAGGLGRRLADRLSASGFPARFTAKGRFESRLRELPVKVLTYPEPGLFGAAAAFVELCREGSG